MANNTEQYLQHALKIAQRSPFTGYKTGAVISYYGKPVSQGWSHMSGIRHKQSWSLHAEIHAMGRCSQLRRKTSHASAFEIYVGTLRGNTNRIVDSKPCLTCAIALRSAGFTRAFYTTPTEFAVLDLEADLAGLKVYSPRTPVNPLTAPTPPTPPT